MTSGRKWTTTEILQPDGRRMGTRGLEDNQVTAVPRFERYGCEKEALISAIGEGRKI